MHASDSKTEESDVKENLLSDIDILQEKMSQNYIPTFVSEATPHHKIEKRKHWCCRPVNFQRWFIVAGAFAIFTGILAIYVYSQVVDFEIHYVSGTSEMRTNKRVGALERGIEALKEKMEFFQHEINVLQEAFHETHPNYVFKKK